MSRRAFIFSLVTAIAPLLFEINALKSVAFSDMSFKSPGYGELAMRFLSFVFIFDLNSDSTRNICEADCSNVHDPGELSRWDTRIDYRIFDTSTSTAKIDLYTRTCFEGMLIARRSANQVFRSESSCERIGCMRYLLNPLKRLGYME